MGLSRGSALFRMLSECTYCGFEMEHNEFDEYWCVRCELEGSYKEPTHEGNKRYLFTLLMNAIYESSVLDHEEDVFLSYWGKYWNNS